MPITGPFYIYYPPEAENSGVSPKQLRHRYFAKITPDGNFLVPGVLQQGLRPKNGNWLDVTRINRALAKRYFVKITPFGTLVPGALIEDDKHPGVPWKEIKRREAPFHRFQITNMEYQVTEVPEIVDFSPLGAFNALKVVPVLQTAFPQRNLQESPVSYKLFYHLGTFDSINNDPTKLSSFSPSSHLRLRFGAAETPVFVNTSRSDILSEGSFQLLIEAAIGIYCIVLGILSPNQEITDYIVLEGVVRKIPLVTV